MNAARPLFLALTSASVPSAALPAAPTPRAFEAALAPRAEAKAKPKARRSKKAPETPVASCDEYLACLEQARICREQAQEAARLKRFRAAVGLFQTAISLCQRAVSLRSSDLAALGSPPLDAAPQSASASGVSGASGNSEACEYLQILLVEMSAYDELARSMNRPLLDSAR